MRITYLCWVCILVFGRRLFVCVCIPSICVHHACVCVPLCVHYQSICIIFCVYALLFPYLHECLCVPYLFLSLSILLVYLYPIFMYISVCAPCCVCV